MVNKICIGTVQFGLEYGINNKIGIPNNNQISGIFKTATKFGVSTIDTANAYGNAQKKISGL